MSVPTFGHLWMGDAEVVVDLHDNGEDRTIRLRFRDERGLTVWGPVVNAPRLIADLGAAEAWRVGERG